MFEKFRPLGDRILVQLLEEEGTTQGGIIIPDVAKEKTQMGIVKAVGPGKVDAAGKVMTVQVKVGDRVYLPKYAGTDAGDDYRIVREDDVLGILEQR